MIPTTGDTEGDHAGAQVNGKKAWAWLAHRSPLFDGAIRQNLSAGNGKPPAKDFQLYFGRALSGFRALHAMMGMLLQSANNQTILPAKHVDTRFVGYSMIRKLRQAAAALLSIPAEIWTASTPKSKGGKKSPIWPG